RLLDAATEAGGRADGQAIRPESATGVETFTAAELMQTEIPEPRCAVDGVVAEGVNLLCSKPKLAKSCLAVSLSLSITTAGVALGTIKVKRGDVLYLALEDSKRRLKSRLKTILGKQQTPPPENLTLARTWPRQDKGGLQAIAEWLEAHKHTARLVIIDTWQK